MRRFNDMHFHVSGPICRISAVYRADTIFLLMDKFQSNSNQWKIFLIHKNPQNDKKKKAVFVGIKMEAM